jgi:hypothetical protein
MFWKSAKQVFGRQWLRVGWFSFSLPRHLLNGAGAVAAAGAHEEGEAVIEEVPSRPVQEHTGAFQVVAQFLMATFIMAIFTMDHLVSTMVLLASIRRV